MYNNTLKQRNANFELLRIFAIFAVVRNHFEYLLLPQLMHLHDLGSTASNVSFTSVLQSHTSGIIISNIINTGDKIGVCVFFLISGYFSIKSNFSTKKVWTLWKIVLFYNILLAFANGRLINFSNFTLLDDFFINLASSFFPIITGTYWFITAYFLILSLSPFISTYIQKISQSKFLLILVSWSFFFYAINVLVEFRSFHAGVTLPQTGLAVVNGSLQLSPVCLLFYCVGAYFKLYPPKKIKALIFGFLGFGAFAEIVFLHLLWSSVLPTGFESISRENESIQVLPISIAVFLIFSRVNMTGTTQKVINSLSSNILEVYLFHFTIFAVFMFSIKKVLAADIVSTQYWFTFDKLTVFGFFFSILIFFLCIGFAEIRIRAARTIFSLKPFQTAKSKFNELFGEKSSLK